MNELRQLRAENEQLKARGLGQEDATDGQAPNSESNAPPATTSSQQSTSSSTSGAALQPRYVYVPRERKCSKFTGKLSADLLTVDQWVKEARRCLDARPLPDAEQVLFLYDHLDGAAKAEVEFHEISARDTAEKIFRILTENFSCSKSYVAAQLSFFQRHQKEGESLRDFSHSLKTLMEVVVKKTPEGVSNSDRVLRDQFAEGVNDDMLRRELKRRLALDPSMDFLTLRGAAIKWLEEGRQEVRPRPRAFSFDTYTSMGGGSGVQSNAITAPNGEIAELKEAVRRQQTQLDAILSHLNASRPQGNQRGGGNSSKSHRYQQDGKPICSRCNRVGHIAKYCRVELDPPNAPTRGASQRATSNHQVAEQLMPLQPQEN